MSVCTIYCPREIPNRSAWTLIATLVLVSKFFRQMRCHSDFGFNAFSIFKRRPLYENGSTAITMTHSSSGRTANFV